MIIIMNYKIIKVFMLLCLSLLLLVNVGCLARYGKSRCVQLCSSMRKLSDNNQLTEEYIKKTLGKPGYFQPVSEENLDLDLLEDLDKYKNIMLAPNTQKLYANMRRDKANGKLESVKVLSYVYDRMGFADPSLAIYIGNYTESAIPRVIGWDYVKYDDKREKFKIGYINYNIDGFDDYLRVSYTSLIDTIIGLKQFAGEIIKSPLSFIEAEFIKNIIVEKKVPFYRLDGFKAAIEDWKNGFTALRYRYMIDGKQGVLKTTQNLLGEVPVIGSIFDQWCGRKSGTSDKLFLTRGIYGGDDTAQNTALWKSFFESEPELCVNVIPYRYGSIVDTIWSMLNLSHGYAYDMASDIVFNYKIRPGDSVFLCGHSSGVQRIVSTARILNDDGIKTKKMFGIAGPALGYAPCGKTAVELNGRMGQDTVSDVSRIINYITFNSLTNIEWKYYKDVDERFEHRTPGFVDGKNRLKYDGFLRQDLKDFFR
jgi:hypothetical protein